jgi:hypothetical protein
MLINLRSFAIKIYIIPESFERVSLLVLSIQCVYFYKTRPYTEMSAVRPTIHHRLREEL